MIDDEHQWLERFRRGEPGAFDVLYAEYGPRLYRFGMRLCGRPADAEDLTQEVFLAAYRSLHRFEERSTLATYLYRIAVYRWQQMRRGREPEAISFETYEGKDPAAFCTDPARSGLARMELEAALTTLPGAQRAAFLLVKVEGFTCREAAESLCIPVGTVKYQVFEAVRKLRVRLGDRCDNDNNQSGNDGALGKEKPDNAL